MLSSIRKFSTSFLGKVVIALIAIAFVVGFGFSGSFSGKQNIVAEINDEKISTLDQLITILRNKRAGDEITVEILRNQNIITLDFTLDLRPSDV